MPEPDQPLSLPPDQPAAGPPVPPIVRTIVYLFTLGLLWFLVVPIVTQLVRPFCSPPACDLFEELSLFVTAYAPACLMAWSEARPISGYGLPLAALSIRRFAQGFTIGLAEISLLVGCIAAFGGYSFGAIALHGAQILGWALYWLVFFLVVGLAEEFAFRGYSQLSLARAIGFWPAAITLSVGFGAIHLGNPGEGWIGLVSIVETGLVLAFTLRRTGNLWLAVGWHAAFDLGETFLYSVPDSGTLLPGHLSSASLHGPVWLTGGSVGPEASLFTFLLMALSAVFVHFAFPAGKSVQPAD